MADLQILNGRVVYLDENGNVLYALPTQIGTPGQSVVYDEDGNLTPGLGLSTLGSLSNVDSNSDSAAVGQVLSFNGVYWEAVDLSVGGVVFDSSYVQARQSYNYDLLINAPFVFDSTDIQSIVNADYVTSLGVVGTDSAAVGNIIANTVNNTYIRNRQDYAYSSLTGVPTTVSTFSNDVGYLTSAVISGGVGINYNTSNNTISIDSAELASYFSTDNITEGSNLYYVKSRVDSDIEQGFNDRTTDNLEEGSNLYYTDARVDSNIFANGFSVGDNIFANIGDSNDLQFYHNGIVGRSLIRNNTGTLQIEAPSFNVNQIGTFEGMIAATGGGSVELYYDGDKKIETTTTGIDVTGEITADSATIAQDLTVGGKLYVTDSSRIANYLTVDLDLNVGGVLVVNDFAYLQLNAYVGNDLEVSKNLEVGDSSRFDDNVSIGGYLDVNGAITGATLTGVYTGFDSDLDAAVTGGVGISYNTTNNTISIDSAELASYFSTDNITEGDNLYYTDARVDSNIAHNGISLNSSVFAKFGDGNELQIGRFGANNFITGTSGTLFAEVPNFSVVRQGNFENMIVANGDGSVELYYDGSKKIETIITGIDVTGEIVVDSATIAQNLTAGGAISGATLSGIYLGFDSDFSAKSTSNLTEGSNLYYTTARVTSLVDSAYVQARQDDHNLTSDASNTTVAANFIPAANDTYTLGSSTNKFSTVFGAMPVYDSIGLLPNPGLPGEMGFVPSAQRIFISTGAGWFKLLIDNAAPSILSITDSDGGVSPFTLSVNQQPTTITIEAIDSDGDFLTFSAVADSAFGTFASISQDANVFTITPFSVDSAPGAGTGIVTFSVTDGLGTSTSEQTFTIDFRPDWSSVSLQQRIIASDYFNGGGDTFGDRVAISGDTAVVSAFLTDDPGDGGAVYVFTRSGSTWTEQQKIRPSDIQAGDYFGRGVAINGDILVVGADHEDSAGIDAGAAYVFTRSGSTWTEQQKLIASDAQAGDNFGVKVALSGNIIVVGAEGEDSNANDAGAAYVFTTSDGGSTWTEQAKLQASDPQGSAEFGDDVAIDGNTIAVGAAGADGIAGAVYVFTTSDGGSTWTQQQKLTASDAQVVDIFGQSVAIDGDTIVVGAPGEDTPGSSAGAAYVFTRSGSTWTEQQKIQSSDIQAGDYFGGSVDILNEAIIVGAVFEDTGGSNAGAAYIFTRDGTTWTQQAKIQASTPTADDHYGASVAIGIDTAVVGARYDDTGAVADNGAAYIYTAPYS